MIDFRHVSVWYSVASRPVLDDISLHIPEGDLVLVIGRTGAGKSTLLGTFNGLVPRFTGGRLGGTVTVGGRSTANRAPRELAELVGYVGQDPLAGFVTDVVEEEIAYGMEQLGVPPQVMRKRVEETLDLLGIGELRRRSLRTLSGGQQQRVAIAAVLAAQPQLLVLDEPTSALDPTAAADVLSAIGGLVQDAGLTVVLAEHRVERVMKQVDKVLWIDGSGQVELGAPGQVLAHADVRPPLAELAATLGWDQVPLSVREARRRVHSESLVLTTLPAPIYQAVPGPGEVAATMRGLNVHYGPIAAVRDLDLTIRAGEVTALMGRNGAGKSSLLWAMQGGLPSTGELEVLGADPRQLDPREARRRIILVPQTASDLLYLPSVAAECAQADHDTERPVGSTRALLESLGLKLAPDTNPHDLSEGQRLALVLAIQVVALTSQNAGVLLLDEPTRGLDYELKAVFARLLRGLAAKGLAVLVSTHDTEFAAVVSDRTVVMADAEIVADGPTRQICTSSPAYAPQVARVFAPAAVLTVTELRRMLGGERSE